MQRLSGKAAQPAPRRSIFGSDKDRLSLVIWAARRYPLPRAMAIATELALQFSVVIDTCSLARPRGPERAGRDPYLEGADVQLLLSDALRAGHPVTVPEIVVREMVKHYREDLTKAINEVDRHLRRAAELVRVPIALPTELALDAAVAGYERWLREYLAQTKRCTIVPIPPSARDGLQLIERDLASRRPFNTAGRGMRDTVLWLSVLSWLDHSSTRVALITENVTDFCEDGVAGRLHPDLLADLAAGRRGRVEHFASIKAFAEAHIKPVSERLDSLRAELERGTHPTFDLRHALVQAAGPILAADPLPDVWVPRPRGSQLTLEVAEVRDLRVDELYRVSSDQYYVEGTATLHATLRLAVPSAGALDLLASIGYERTKPASEQRVPAFTLQNVGSDGATGKVAIERIVRFTLVIGPDGAGGVTFELVGQPEQHTRAD
jgi:hypothetical protein